MVGKRKCNDEFILTVQAGKDTTSSVQPQKRRKQQRTTAADAVYTVAQIHVFRDGVSKIRDWTSVSVINKYVQVIYWFDIEGLSKEECAKRYPNKAGQPCSMTNIFKVYNTYAPRFYAEKGVEYIPLGKRGAAKARVQKVVEKKRGQKVERVKSNPLDVRLKELFQSLSAPKLPSENKAYDQDTWTPCLHHSTPSGTDDVYRDEETVTFVCRTSSTTYGPPSGLQIPRTSVLHHCTTMRQSLLKNPRIDTIAHGPEISLDTVSCFAACISPTVQPTLPTHVTTPYGTFEQEWSMAELENLYVLAVTLGAGSVCDLIIDRWVEDVRRPEPRIVVDEFGEARYFGILGFGPELLVFLWMNDKKGFAFFANVLISHGMKGYERMKDTHLANWHDSVKKALTKTIEGGSAIDLSSASRESICAKFHHQSPEDFTSLCKTPPQPRPKAAAAPKTSVRPTLNTRARYDDFEENAPNILRLTVPRFPHVHNKRPQISPVDIDPIYALAEHGTDRLREHRDAHLDKRMQYANLKFNARHDTEDVCREKLRMCREKVALFEAEGIEISDEEVEKVLDGQEGVDGDEEGEDEDQEI